MTIESKCNLPQAPDYSGVTIVELSPDPVLDDYLQAMALANEQAEKLITAEQKGAKLAITFEHGVGQNQHRFIIEDIARSEEEGEVDVSWDGSSIGRSSFPGWAVHL